MTQEEIDQMIEDWVKNGFPSELKQLIPDEEKSYDLRKLSNDTKGK